MLSVHFDQRRVESGPESTAACDESRSSSSSTLFSILLASLCPSRRTRNPCPDGTWFSCARPPPRATHSCARPTHPFAFLSCLIGLCKPSKTSKYLICGTCCMHPALQVLLLHPPPSSSLRCPSTQSEASKLILTLTIASFLPSCFHRSSKTLPKKCVRASRRPRRPQQR